MGRTDHVESQRQASMTLEFFCRTFIAVGESIRDAIGQSLYELIMEDSEAYYSKMTNVHADILLSNKLMLSTMIDNRRS